MTNQETKTKALSLEEIQKISLEILLQVTDLCEKLKLRYFLAWGTLIGAIRHKGFIPWDDDVDIWVPRADYEKFVQYCIDNKKKIKPFELHHYKTNKKYIYPIARFSDSRYTIKYNIAKDYGLGTFVDVYPLDNYDETDKKQKKIIHKYEKIISTCGNKTMVKKGNLLRNILKYPYYKMVVCRYASSLDKMIAKMDTVCQKNNNRQTNRFSCLVWNCERRYYKNEWLYGKGKKSLKFNGTLFRVPYDYDRILREIYGDYMVLPPVEEQVGHHDYVAYKK